MREKNTSQRILLYVKTLLFHFNILFSYYCLQYTCRYHSITVKGNCNNKIACSLLYIILALLRITVFFYKNNM